MPPKSRTAYCDLIAYVESKHPDLYEAFTGVCLKDTLSRGGITLIIPKDAKKLASDAWSDDPETIRATRERLLAHVLHGAHKEIAANAEANTRQLQPRAVKLMKKGTDGVTITTGPAGKTVTATAKIASDFNDASARNNNAVWIIESGDISADGVVVTIRKPGARTGGYAGQDDRSANLRYQAVSKIEKAAIDANSAEAAREVFMSASRGLACLIHTNDPTLYYSRVLPLLAHTFLDIYMMVEPHKPVMGSYLIDDVIIEEWAKAGSNGGHKTAKLPAFQKTVDEAPRGQNALIYDAPRQLAAELAAIRTRIVAHPDISSTLAAIKEVYVRLENENQVGEAKGMYPEAACRANKLALDDLRFYAEVNLMHHFETRSKPGAIGVFARIADALHGDGPTRFVTSDALVDKIAAGEELTLIRGFVNSAFFASFPLQSAIIPELSNYQSTSFGKRGSETFFNPLYGAATTRAGTTGGGARRTRLVGALKRAGFEPTEAQLAAIEQDF